MTFRAGAEPTRVFPVQVWQTPFTSDEHSAARPVATGFLARIGNPDLVRGISDALSLARLAQDPDGAPAAYEDLIAAAGRLNDAYHWLDREEALGLAQDVRAVRDAADRDRQIDQLVSILDELKSALGGGEDRGRRR